MDEIINNNTYENSLKEIIKARNLVLDEYNTFKMLMDICINNNEPEKQKKLVLKPEEYFQSRSYRLYKEFKKKPFYFIFNLFKGKIGL